MDINPILDRANAAEARVKELENQLESALMRGHYLCKQIESLRITRLRVACVHQFIYSTPIVASHYKVLQVLKAYSTTDGIVLEVGS